MTSSSSEAEATAVSSIFIYPVKSCRGISVSQAPITPTGFRWDRQWAAVNVKGRAYTQRVEPKLALVVTELPNEAFSEGWEPTASSYLCMLKAPDMDVLKISLSKPSEIADGVSEWEWSGSALDEGEAAAKWFSDYLGKPGRLVRFNTVNETRLVDPTYGRGHNVMFSDGFPFMLLSQGSVDALNILLQDPIPVNCFQPNILVDVCEPYAEEVWKEVKINKFIFEGVKLCSRCKICTINQENGVSSSEPTEAQIKYCAQLKNNRERSTLGRI